MSTITRDRIDTKEGIVAMLGSGESLAGFTTLVAERRRWVKEHPNERLSKWYVLGGRVYLDEFGQTHTATFRGIVDWVQSGDKKPELETTWSSRSIPRDHDRCLHCDGAITVRQLGAVVVAGFNHETDRLNIYHGECAIMRMDTARRDEFGLAFQQAGLREVVMHSMPSHYAETNWTGPWYRVESPQLGRLLIGWRRSVIHLGWPESVPLAKVNGMVLFKDEGVTVDDKMVHAWGGEKLAAYLGALWKAIV